jgi:predicted AlkP superfamily phosphohydrolase/phosphomutase
MKISRNIAPLFVLAVLSTFLLVGCSSGPKLPPEERLLVIGVDGADWEIVRTMVEDGRLPVMSSLGEDGVRARIISMPRAISPVVWATLSTGKDYRQHGIDGFVFEDPVTKQQLPFTSTMRKCKAVWNILSENDYTVGVIGWWTTWPAEEVNGYMVSSHIPFDRRPGEPDKPFKGVVDTDLFGQTYPEGLINEIEDLIVTPSQITKSDLERFVPREFLEMSDEEIQGHISALRWAHASDKSFLAIANKLAVERPTDALFVYIAGADVCSHRFWKYFEPAEHNIPSPSHAEALNDVVYKYYEYVDEQIGKLIETSGIENVMIVADHGFRAADHEIWSGQHDAEGVLLMSGEAFGSGWIHNVTMFDVTPTILSFFSLPAAKDMQGNVLTQALEDEVRTDLPVQIVDTYESSEREIKPVSSPVDQDILERLRSLGYID